MTVTLYSLAAILSRAIFVLQVPLFAESLTAEEFGYLDILCISTVLANFIVSIEIGQGVGICTAQADSAERRSQFLSTSFNFAMIAYGIFLIFTLGTSRYVAGWLFANVDRTDTVIAWGLATALQGVFLISHNHLRWLLRPWPYFLVAVLYCFLAVSLSWYFGIALDYRLSGIMYGQALAAMIGCVFSSLLWRDMFICRVSLSVLREMLRFSLPLVPSSVAVLVVLYIDRLLVTLLLSWDDLGAYGVSYRLAALMAIFPVAVNAALPPILYSSAQDRSFNHRLSEMFIVYVIVVLIGTGLLILFTPFLTNFLGAEVYAREANLLVPILGAGILASVLYNFVPGLVLARASKLIALISLSVALFSIPLTYGLISFGGLVGAAVAPLITSVITFILWVLASRTLSSVELPIIKACQYSVVVTILYAFALTGNASWGVPLVLATLLALVVVAVEPLRRLTAD